MPTYEYRCRRCGHGFEAFHAMSATPPSCPNCVAHSPERVISGGGGVLFRGPGFHATDYPRPTPADAPAERTAVERC